MATTYSTLLQALLTHIQEGNWKELTVRRINQLEKLARQENIPAFNPEGYPLTRDMSEWFLLMAPVDFRLRHAMKKDVRYVGSDGAFWWSREELAPAGTEVQIQMVRVLHGSLHLVYWWEGEEWSFWLNPYYLQ